jgi:hypothetical protein
LLASGLGVSIKEERGMLTNTACKNLRPQAKPYEKSDAGGLYLLVKPSGSKHWYMGYRFGGRQKKLSFGAYPEITLADAREKREAARRLVAHDTDSAVNRRRSAPRQPRDRTGPLSLIGARAKLLQHWADRIDAMVGSNVVPMKA